MNIKKLTAETTGTVIKSTFYDGLRLTVAYAVDGKAYTLKENIKVRSEVIKIGFLPIGREKTWVIKEKNVGDQLTIMYNPVKPQKAHIKGNDGFFTT